MACKCSYDKLKEALTRAGKSDKEADRLAKELAGQDLCEVEKPKKKSLVSPRDQAEVVTKK